VRRATSGIEMQDLPVALLPISRLWHARIRFQPLFTEGGLALVQGGFEVYVRASHREIRPFQHAFEEDERDGGRSLPTRVRFTLAHELAHTLFFERRGEATLPVCLVEGQRGPELQRLERECSALAGELLVPRKLLNAAHSAIGRIESPTQILDLAKRFAVSPDCIVIQLEQLIREHYDRHAVCIASIDGNSIALDASTFGGSADRILRSRNGELRNDAAEVIQGFLTGLQNSVTCTLPVSLSGRDGVQDLTLACEKLQAERSLIWLELSGEARLKEPVAEL
jgi:hypothetical protein